MESCLLILLPDSVATFLFPHRHPEPCPRNPPYALSQFIENFSQAEKELLSPQLQFLSCLAVLAGGVECSDSGSLRKRNSLACRSGWVCIYACVVFSPCVSPLSYLWMVPVCCPLLSADRREKRKKAGPFPFGFEENSELQMLDFLQLSQVMKATA